VIGQAHIARMFDDGGLCSKIAMTHMPKSISSHLYTW
jgi:hypothetical protein